MVALTSAPFVFAFVVSVCSMLVVISNGASQPSVPCPNGTYPIWHRRCIYINDNHGDNELWRVNRQNAHVQRCDGLTIGGYKWNLPSFQFNGKHERLFEILRERACDGDECSNDEMSKMKEWRFWIRLVRQWKTTVDEKGTNDEVPMDDVTKWTWGKDGNARTLADDMPDGACKFPPWANREPNVEFHTEKTREPEVCVISKIKEDGTYPWFEWVVAPCELDHATGGTADNLRGAMKTNGILMCEGIPPSQDGITSTSSSTPPVETTTAHVPSIVWRRAFMGILVSFICSVAFLLACSVLFCVNRRRIHQLESTAKKSKYVSTTSSDIPSMSTLVNLDSIGRRADDDDESERERSRRKGKKKCWRKK